MGLVRVTDGKTVHFRNPCDRLLTVCGSKATVPMDGYLGGLGTEQPMRETGTPVNCPACATIWCAAKYEPWHAVEDQAMDRAMLAAVGVNPDAFADGVDQPTESEVQ